MVPLLWQLVTFAGDSMTVNYGLDRVRFPAPVPVGRSIRLHARVASATPTTTGAELALALTVEMQGSEKPACVAQAVYRHIV